MKNRTRPVQIKFHLTGEEKDLLDQKMEQANMPSKESFIRKMLFTGYVIKLDLEPVKQIVSLLGYCSNNLNQLARRANSYESISAEDIQAMRKAHDELLNTTIVLLEKVAQL